MVSLTHIFKSPRNFARKSEKSIEAKTIGLLAAVVVMGSSGFTLSATNTVVAPKMGQPKWKVAGVIPESDQIVGFQPSRSDMWVLTRIPATANSPSGYQVLGIQKSKTNRSDSIKSITPSYLPPSGNQPTAWGREPDGTWWMIWVPTSEFSNVHEIKTAIWHPGLKHWSVLKPVVIKLSKTLSEEGFDRKIGSVINGFNGTPWVVITANNVTVVSASYYQTLVYRMANHDWKQVLNSEAVHVNAMLAGEVHWSTPANSSHLFLDCVGLEPIVLSKSGVFNKWTIPLSWLKHWYRNGMDGVMYMSPSDTAYYWRSNTMFQTTQLFQWHNTNKNTPKPLIAPGTLLAKETLHFEGFWGNQPVLFRTTNGMAYIYDHGLWHKAPELVRNGHIVSWSGNALWYRTDSGHVVWTSTTVNGYY